MPCNAVRRDRVRVRIRCLAMQNDVIDSVVDLIADIRSHPNR